MNDPSRQRQQQAREPDESGSRVKLLLVDRSSESHNSRQVWSPLLPASLGRRGYQIGQFRALAPSSQPPTRSANDKPQTLFQQQLKQLATHQGFPHSPPK